MIKTIRQAADAFLRAFTPQGFTKEEPGATLARALIHPKTNETVARVNDSGELTGSAVTALITASALPAGIVAPYAGTVAPTGWLFGFGQAVSRTTYAALFTAIGTTYGVGDGSMTFNLPDLRGRVVAGKDDMGGSSANRLTDQDGGLNGDTLGDTGGAETHTLTSAEMPSHTHGYPLDTTGEGSPASALLGSNNNTANTSLAGGDAPHNNIQPTIILNYIIKI